MGSTVNMANDAKNLLYTVEMGKLEEITRVWEELE
jgi:hypothetical protein